MWPEQDGEDAEGEEAAGQEDVLEGILRAAEILQLQSRQTNAEDGPEVGHGIILSRGHMSIHMASNCHCISST